MWTDGSCIPNPGPGGWAVLLRSACGETTLVGSEPQSTNNRMELVAAIKALEYVDSNVEVHLHTDSNYVKQGITTWIHSWKRNGWISSSRRAVKNIDLWQELDSLNSVMKVSWYWVKAHSGMTENEIVDGLARQAAKEQLDLE